MTSGMARPAIKMQVCNDLEQGGVVTVRRDGVPVFDLDPGALKAVYVMPGTQTIELEGSFGRIEHTFKSEGEERIKMSLRQRRLGLLDRLTGKSAVHVVEIERAFHAAYVPPPEEKLTLQFWAGTATDSDAFWSVFAERDFPEAQTDEEQWAQDDTPISLFAETQGEVWIDHDATEGAFVGEDGAWADRVGAYSWNPLWVAEVERRAIAAGYPRP
jgi:hypothetical protein